MKNEKIIELMKKLSARQVAKRLIDNKINELSGLTSMDLSDSVTLMNGLDTVEEYLARGAIGEAKMEADIVAQSMLAEEGFPIE
ncbi:hypothetical protein D6827_02910 [Candidatus Parcubacteria bacterium]|nr:MAG: hypothetical protein D6827_02910 [Candidatus Parcubacteria bacterium]